LKGKEKYPEMEYIVDTNVLLVANGQSDMSLPCVEHCVRFVQSFWGQHVLVIDDQYLVLGEYLHKLRTKRGGIGDKFLKLVLTRHSSVKRVSITRSGNTDHDFVEYPETLSSVDIDLSDKKFIALSKANNSETPIAQASDSKWIGWAVALEAEGIKVEFLCKGELSEIFQKKMG
jgi:hypothetical protein